MIPRESEFEVPILVEVASAGGSGRPRELYPKIASHFQQITKADWMIKTKAGATLLTNRIQWARNNLVKKGELDKTVHGLWRITDKGRARLRASVGIQPRPQPTRPRSPVQHTTSVLPALNAVTKSRHEELCQKIRDMGSQLNKNTDTWSGALYRHDAVWRDNPYKSPGVAWEVCDSGNVDKDITSLQWACENWGASGILFMVDASGINTVKQKLPRGKDIQVVSAEDVDRLSDLVKQNRDLLRVILA